ncbi:G patch domain and ankyrin repeat-containing protein 1 homolog [Battus philenor]|uniref:G patch domain and ankyrin repeat-containing protein 1 homolog n=1 Tax=Battus philenor TaxID=42288 RepID=UPI0035D02EBD
MEPKLYANFVRPTSPSESVAAIQKAKLSGTEAKKLYLEEIRDARDTKPAVWQNSKFDLQKKSKTKKFEKPKQFCEKELFLSVQDNDLDKLVEILDKFPNKLNILDSYGWSLLMMACQANATDIVKELLMRGIDTSVRDKAGNSACTLVIKNKNYIIADLLLGHKSIKSNVEEPQTCSIEEYTCEICNNKKFLNKQQHLSSTVHNINVSKGKKLPTNFVIPESNKGYQIMLKVGWDKETGLGPDGSGKKYPIRAIKKTDKTGLGHKKKTKEKILNEEHEKIRTKNLNKSNYHKNSLMEINFRRMFY